jgi:hypothetical protein
MENLEFVPIDLPAVGMKGQERLTAKELGIGYAVLIDPDKIFDHIVFDEEKFEEWEKQQPGVGAGTLRPGMPRPPVAEAGQNSEFYKTLRRFDFEVQFCWQEKPPSKREEERNKPAGAQPAVAQPAVEAEAP